MDVTFVLNDKVY